MRVKRPEGSFVDACRRAGRPLLLVSGVIMLRSFANVGFTAFFPTFLVGQGASLWMGGAAVAVFEATGALGALMGGTVSDRLGRKTVMVFGQLAAAPLLLAAVLVEPGLLQLAILGLAGFVQFLQGPVQMTLVQELMPENRGMATGISFFLGLEGATIGAIAIGLAGDLFGLGTALMASVLLSMLSLPMVFGLPETRGRVQSHA
jgi:FSR family fosmidomycin resistance protein-like MFS transporter